MAVTVRGILEMPAYHGFRVLAGAKGLDREVLRTTVGDAPDCYKWSQGGEFIVTSGYAFREPGVLAEVIRGCAEYGGAAFGTKLRYIGTPEAEALAAADELDFPLIEIPAEFPFAEILHPVQGRVIDDQAHLLRYSALVQKTFFDLSTHSAGLDDILHTLRVFTHFDLALRCTESSFDRCCAEPGRFADDVARLSLDELTERYPWRRTVLDGGAAVWLIFDARPEQLDEMWSEIPITQANGALMLHFQRWSSGALVERRYRDEFVLDILTNNLRLPDEVWNRARSFGWNLAGPKHVVICDIDNYKKTLSQAAAGGTAPRVEAAKSRIFALCRDCLRRISPRAPYAELSDLTAFILPPCDRDVLDGVLVPLHEEVLRQTGFTISIGVSMRCGDIFAAWKGYDQARRAVELTRSAHGGGLTAYWSDMGVQRVLTAALRDTAAAEFIAAQIGPLCDSKNETLLETMRALCAHACNMKETAAALHVHYNTLKYRLGRIREVLGHDFDNAESLFRVDLALRLCDLNRINDKFLSK